MSAGDESPFEGDISHDDARLVQQMGAGDPDLARSTFEALYRTHAPALARFAYGYVRTRAAAEDLVADVFLAVWIRRQSWAPRYGIRAYLYAAIRHRALNARRTDERAVRNLGEYALARTDATTGADTALDAAERRASLDAAIAALPDDSRRLAELRWTLGMSPAEIAEILGINKAAVLNRLSRLVRRLQTLVR